MVPCSMKVRLALKRITREHSLALRYVEVPPTRRSDMCAWVDSMVPTGAAASDAQPITALHVTCGNCYSGYSHGQGLRNGRTAVESDLNPEAAAELREAWQDM